MSPRVIKKIVDPNEHDLTTEVENLQQQTEVAKDVFNSLHLPRLTNELVTSFGEPATRF